MPSIRKESAYAAMQHKSCGGSPRAVAAGRLASKGGHLLGRRPRLGGARPRRKGDSSRQPKATPAGPTAPPADAIRRARGDTGFQPVERRPFRNVEVRKLGPGRGHNRPRGPYRRALAGPVER